MQPGKILRAAALCLVTAGFVPVSGCAPGWKLLFDGKTTTGWRGFKKDSMPSGWQVVDGSLTRVASAGDIMTRDKYRNSGILRRAATAGSSTVPARTTMRSIGARR